MSEIRSRILGRLPFAGRRIEEQALEDWEVALAVDEISSLNSLSLEDARILAFAFYSGVKTDDVLITCRRAGPETILRRELASHAPRTCSDPDLFVRMLENGGSPFTLSKSLGDDLLGWAVAVMSMVADADISALEAAVAGPEDGTRLVALYALVTYVPQQHRKTFIARLLSAGDSMAYSIAVRLAFSWIEEAVLNDQGRDFTEILLEIENHRSMRIPVFGALLDDVLRWLRTARLSEQQSERGQQLYAQLDAVGRKIVSSAQDVDEILRRSGARDVQVLAAMSHWRNDDAFAKEASTRISSRAQELFEREFGSIMELTDDQALREAFLPEWVVDPLIQALIPGGIQKEKLLRLYNGLAADSFSRMTRYGAWLTDRKRAIALAVVAGVVARERGDDDVLDTVRWISEDLSTQPKGFHVVLHEGAAAKVEATLGFAIPDR